MKLKIFSLLVFMTFLGVEAAHAYEGVFPPWFKLMDADRRAIDEAEDRILARKDIKSGTSEAWKGKGTGNIGKVTIVKLFEKKGLSCMETAYDFKLENAADPIRFTIPWCKVADGSWKMYF